MDSNIEKLYNKINNNQDFIIFGLSTCRYCKEAIMLLKNKNIKYKNYYIDKYNNLFFKVFQELSELYPNFNIDKTHKTVPVIFYKKKFVGGYTELKKILNS